MEKREEEFRRDENTEIRMRTTPAESETYRRTREPVSWEDRRPIMERERLGVGYETWRPPTGGLLEILAGAANILAGIAAVVGGTFLSGIVGDATASFFGTVAGVGLGVVLMVLGIISVVGGAMALRRRRWGWSLAGAITALFPTPAIFLGMLSLIFVVLGKNEFHQTE